MTGFVRQQYGRSGSRLNGVLVVCLPPISVDSIWLRFVMTFLWILIAVTFCRYSVPSPAEKETVIDTSRIADMKELQELEIAKKLQTPPEEIQPADPEPEPPKAIIEKTIDPLSVPLPEVAKPLTITRPSQANQSLEPPPVRTTRDRMMTAEEARMPSARIVRDASRITEAESRTERKVREFAAPVSASGERITIRQAASRTAIVETRAERKARVFEAAPISATEARVTIRQQNSNAKMLKEDPTIRRTIARQQVGADYASTPTARIERTMPVASVSSRIIVKNREREQLPVSGTGSGTGAAGRGKVQGVSFQSLDVCPTVREEEEKIRRLLSMVGTSSSCGEFRFTGTDRISSFNMLIDAPKGRRLSNRCEELDNAFNCLKKNR